jgi:uncharacterized membrane protein
VPPGARSRGRRGGNVTAPGAGRSPNEPGAGAAAGLAAGRPWALAALFAALGALHLVRPAPFVAIVPHWLPDAPLAVLAAGGAALLGAAGVLVRRTRRAAGWGLLAFLVAVFPANVQMLQNARGAGAPPTAQLLLWLRLPLQLVLLAWVWRAAVRPPGGGGAPQAPA